MKDNSDYWIERAEEREEEAYLEGAELSAKLFEEYQRAARRIRQRVSDFYTRYGDRYGLDYEEAVRLLNQSEMQEWKKTLAEYLEAIKAEQDKQLKARLQMELDALSYNSQITRLQALEGQINLELGDLFTKGTRQMREEFGELFTEGYYHKVYDIQQRVGFMAEFAHITTSMVEDIVSYPWSGAHFSDRLWRHKDALIFSTRELLTRGAIEGTSIAQLSKDLANLMGQSYRNAERLITTESAHFHGEATKRAYEAAGVAQYKFIASLDERTCEVCGALDGKIFDMEDRQEGSNAPPIHPRCRCTTVEHDPEEAQDWADSGKEMPERMTYEEWKKEQDIRTAAEEQKKADEAAAKRLKAAAPDDILKANEEKLRQALRDAEEESRGMDHEVGTVLDRQGNVLSVTHGDRGSVEPPEEQLPGNIFTHNHPSGSIFSTQDIESFEASGLYELRASTPQGIVYSIRLGDVVPDSGIGKAYKEYGAMTKALDRLNEEMHRGEISRDAVKQGGWPLVLERMSQMGREWMEENAGKYGYIFTVEDIADE